MKSSRFPILMIFALLGLLVLLATLQYKWLGQISDAEQIRLESRLKDDTKRFADDFNEQIQTLYYNFQIDAENFENKNWNDFNNKYVFWKSQTKSPELAKSFYFLKKDKDQFLLKYSADKSEFEEAVWTGELREIEKLKDENKQISPILELQKTDKKISGNVSVKTEKLIALAIPVYQKDAGIEETVIQTREIDTQKLNTKSQFKLPEKYGYLIVVLDEKVIKDGILNSLVKKYFTGDGNNYKVSINNSNNQIVFQTHDGKLTSKDSTAKLFNLKPNNLFSFSKEIGNLNSDTQIGEKKIIFSQSRTSTSEISETKNKNEEVVSININKIGEGKPRIAVFEENGKPFEGIWTLNVQHESGSLEIFIANTRRRNLLISFGILSLLAVSIILIFFSSQKAKLLAQKQMDFVSSVSHEFRTPLAVIYSASENLSDGVINEQEKMGHYGNLIKREGKKLSGMVEQILEFAGANSGKRKYDFREVSVENFINEAVAECQPLIDEKGFVVEKEFADNLPKINADEKALTLAIQNLINNSLKYSNGNKWLKISTQSGEGNVKITVADKGIGISAKDKKHIFEPFYRSKNVVDEQISGNGLGLSLVKQIIEAHGGKILVESEIGSGSKFIVHLPLNI